MCLDGPADGSYPQIIHSGIEPPRRKSLLGVPQFWAALYFCVHNMHMRVRDTFAPDRVMAELAPLFPALQRSLEFGHQKAVEYYATEKIKRDPYHFAHTMRLRARLALESAGIAAEED